MIIVLLGDLKQKRHEDMSQNPQEKNENIKVLFNNDDYSIEPYVLFDYSIRSNQTRDSYFRRLKTFFNYSKVDGIDFREKCNNFARIGRQYPNQALKLILDFTVSKTTGRTERNNERNPEELSKNFEILL